MNERQRNAVEHAYVAGATEQETADALGISVEEVDAYLSWWCDRGCPGAWEDE